MPWLNALEILQLDSTTTNTNKKCKTSTCPVPQTPRHEPDLPDHGVVGGGDLVEDAVDAGQLLLVLDGDTVISLVVVLQGATQIPEHWGKLVRH